MLTKIIVALMTVFIVLDQRLYIKLDTGGSGILRVLGLAIPLLAIAAEVPSGRIGLRRLTENRNTRPGFVFLLIFMALTILAVIGGGYPARTLMSAVQPTIALAFLLLGARVADQDASVRAFAAACMAFATVFECAVAICQFLTLQGIFNNPLLDWLAKSDRQTMLDFGQGNQEWLIGARSVGTFVNPNELGIWSLIAVLFAVTMMKGRWRFGSIVAGLITLMLSQSRGSILGLIATIALGSLMMGSFARQLRAGLVMVVMMAMMFGWALFQDDSSYAGEISGLASMQTRFAAGARVILEGGEVDRNALGRLQAWDSAVDYLRDQPLGTWGDPFVILPFTNVDNQYIIYALQGSAPLLLGFLATLAGAMLKTKNKSIRPFLLLTAIGLGVNSMSAMPFQTQAIYVFWGALGYSTVGNLKFAGNPGERRYAFRTLLPSSERPDPELATVMNDTSVASARSSQRISTPATPGAPMQGRDEPDRNGRNGELRRPANGLAH